jgi:hypothetical protein
MQASNETSSRRANETDGSSEGIALLSDPKVALIAAGVVGFAVGAVIWQYRRTHPQSFASFDRAIGSMRSGAADTAQKLRRRLREEGYSPAQIEARAKSYLSQLIEAAQARF